MLEAITKTRVSSSVTNLCWHSIHSDLLMRVGNMQLEAFETMLGLCNAHIAHDLQVC